MSSEFLIERATIDFEPTGDGWTVIGRAVPFNVRQRVTDDGRTFYDEEFDPASFDRDISNGGRWVNLMLGHMGDEGERYLGRTIALRADAAALVAEVRLNRAHPQAEAARAGELRGWSVSCRVYKSLSMPNGVVRRMACGLSHIAATAQPQYAGAGVFAVRSAHEVEAVSAPRLEHWREVLKRK